MRKGILLWILALCGTMAWGQNTMGLPNVINYSNGDINAAAQNWMVSQDKFGILYFGNTYGLLTYNGNKWKLFPLPNRTLVRSLKIADDGKIYTGAQDEFGYFSPSGNGTLQFHSLTGLIPTADRMFGDVWNTAFLGKDIFFRTNNRLFKIDANKKVEIFKPMSEWSYMGMVSNQLFAQDKNYGLYVYSSNEWKLITKELNTKTITSMLPFEKGNILITTLKDGVFVLEGNKIVSLPVAEKIKRYHIYTALRIDDNNFALGTTSNGVYFIDKKGSIIRHFSRDSRLQNNNVISMFLDNQSNLWLGLDKGIDMLNYNSAIQKISPVLSTPAACYSARIFENKLFIGTSDGLYSSTLTIPQRNDLSFSNNGFTRVNNTGGQVWGLFGAMGKLLMGHYEGTYEIRNNTAIPVFKDEGSWLYAALPGGTKTNTDIIAGTYLGLHLLKNKNGNITDSGKISGLFESLRFLRVDSLHNTIWASHPYHGIYKIQLSGDRRQVKSVKLYTAKDGLPGTLDNYVSSINHQIVFCTGKGIYRYNDATGRFEPDPVLAKTFGNMSLSVVEEDEKKNIWFVTENKLGLALKNGTINYFPEITGKLISGFEFIYPLNEQNIFIGSNDGLIHINLLKYQQKSPNIQLILDKVVAVGNKDSVLFNGYFTDDKNNLLSQQSPENIDDLPARFNSFHFEFATTLYKQPSDIQYSYQLVGIDKNWSRWSDKNEKDYTNLPYGKYVFRVKARDHTNHESKIVEYTFIILPHWYQTKMAYFIYILLFFLGIAFINRQQTKKFERQAQKYEKEQTQLKYLHKLEIEHNEHEIIQLQKEKLESEVAYKNKELATTTMHLFKRGKLLSKLKEELLVAVQKLPDKESSSDFNRLIKKLKEAEKQDQDWEQFAIHFDEVHNNFLKNLKQTFPDLTSSDLKICAYLKMNLSSKEIAQLLSISLKGVEVARYRLRKKLSLSSSAVNLYDFLMENS